MSLIINNIDFDERLDDLKSFFNYSLDQKRLREKILEIYKETGVLLINGSDGQPITLDDNGLFVTTLKSGHTYWSGSFSWALATQKALDLTHRYGMQVRLPKPVFTTFPQA